MFAANSVHDTSTRRIEDLNKPARTIAIVGGGASGTLVATLLLRSAASGPVDVIVIEPSERLGRGIAYGTSCRSHLLNVRAGAMSAFVAAPSHFTDWLRKNVDPALTAQAFAPRLIYGRYIEEQLQEARRQAPPQLRFEHVRARVLGVNGRADGTVLELHDGRRIEADNVVLALGNPPPSNPLPEDCASLALSPWSAESIDVVGKTDPVLLIGSGLTAVDVALALDDAGHCGPIQVVSRHGRWPLIHGPAVAVRNFMGVDDLPDSVRGLTAALRSGARSVLDDGGPWRGVIDELRPYTNEFWTRLNPGEKGRFLRHLGPFWDIHRHRMAPEVAARLASMCSQGRVLLRAGRIVNALDAPEGGLLVEIRPRGTDELLRLAVRHVINCTGPQTDYRKPDQPLVREMFDQGIARQDALGLGLMTSSDGALFGRDGTPSRVFFTLGPPRKGTLWETTAMPEIRMQAAALANRFVEGI